MEPEVERHSKLLTAAFTSPLGVMPALLQVIEYLIREARAEAWDEGMRTGTSRAMRYMSDEPNLPLASADDNPYRD